MFTSAAIAFICLSYTDPVVGLVGCTTFAMLGGYVAFFHSVRLQVLHLGLGMLTATVLAVRAVSLSPDVIATINIYLVVAIAILALPGTAHVLAHFLGGDLDTSDTDPLTGLLNRRAFYRAAHRLLTTANAGTNHVTVMMIDLDDFKALNDTRGHRTGDMALVAVSELLSRHTATSAVVARIGGEEFLVADLSGGRSSTNRCADRLCAAIAGLDEFHLTASIGIATASLRARPVDADRALIDYLINAADTAMYTAKRAGGNQVWPRE
jgi:diguanylate cyclase (GGDEF)-like protein